MCDITAALLALDTQDALLADVEAVTGATADTAEARLGIARLRGQVESRATGDERLISAEQYLRGVVDPTIDAEGLERAAAELRDATETDPIFEHLRNQVHATGTSVRAKRTTWTTIYEWFAPRTSIRLALRTTSLRVVEVELPHEYVGMSDDERDECEDFGYWAFEAATGEDAVEVKSSVTENVAVYRG